MIIQSINDFNALQAKVLANEPVSDEALAAAVAWVRQFRKTELPAKAAKGAPKAPANLDSVLKDLGL